jgi:hypothetical protein
MKQTSLLFGIAMVFFLATFANATPVFMEDFESGSLNQWTGKSQGAHNGQIVDDPLQQDHAMNFTETNSAGDIFTSVNSFSAGKYEISFDYLGTSDDNDSGGYVGISQGFPGSHQWLWATGTVSNAQDVLIDDGAWHSYNFSFEAAYDFNLMLEDFRNGGVAGDAYFDNIEMSAVPEPGTFVLLGFGLLGAIGYCRKFRK